MKSPLTSDADCWRSIRIQVSKQEYIPLKALRTEDQEKTMTVASVPSLHCNSQTIKTGVFFESRNGISISIKWSESKDKMRVIGNISLTGYPKSLHTPAMDNRLLHYPIRIISNQHLHWNFEIEKTAIIIVLAIAKRVCSLASHFRAQRDCLSQGADWIILSSHDKPCWLDPATLCDSITSQAPFPHPNLQVR